MDIKILHTSDWHLGRTFKESNFDLLPIQKQILDELIEITLREKPDVLIVSGDIFDSYNPPYEAESLFYETLVKISKQNCFVFVVAGNHDSPDKLQIAKPLITGKHSIFIKTSPLENLQDFEFENQFYKLNVEDSLFKLQIKQKNLILGLNCLPYLSEVRLGVSDDKFLQKLKELISKEPKFTCDYFVLTSHLSVLGFKNSGSERVFQIGGVENIPLEYFPKHADYIALGHLHRHQKIKNVTYSGSIFPFDIGEIEHQKGLCCYSENSVNFIRFEKSPSVKKIEFETIEDAIKEAPQDEGFFYLLIKNPQSCSLSSIDLLIQTYRDKLINWRFVNQEISEDSEIQELGTMRDDEMFVEFYKAKMNSEPSNEIKELFLKVLEEVKNASN